MAEFASLPADNRIVNGVRINYREGGAGSAVVLLHGYPQSKLIWHKILPTLSESHRVVMPDLRGYGESEKPDSSNESHEIYCKRTSARDIVELADALNIESFHVVGHDRGARVGHRMALDFPECVLSLTSLDVMPSQAAFDNMDASLAFAWFHWHLMRQPYPLPETLIGNSAETYFDFLMERWCGTEGAIDPQSYATYKSQFCRPETIRATCAEYRSVVLDLEHDEADRGRKLACPVLVLWGADTRKRPGWQTGADLDMIAAWRERAPIVEGAPLPCGHFIPEERPNDLLDHLLRFIDRVESGDLQVRQ